MILTSDIETLPTQEPEIIEQLRATIKPPATHKKPETCAAWMEENAESALAELVAKTSFDGMYGRVACIAWDYFDGSFSTDACMTEREVIRAFFDYIASIEDNQLVFCGHNIVGFDLPFLKHRAIILGIQPPHKLWQAMNAKPWDSCIADTMLMWSSDPHKRGSMDRLCKAFGIAGKDGFDGSMVANEWENGSKEKVIEYCRDDVARTVAMYKRMTFA